jgi:hypothetical protein
MSVRGSENAFIPFENRCVAFGTISKNPQRSFPNMLEANDAHNNRINDSNKETPSLQIPFPELGSICLPKRDGDVALRSFLRKLPIVLSIFDLRGDTPRTDLQFLRIGSARAISCAPRRSSRALPHSRDLQKTRTVGERAIKRGPSPARSTSHLATDFESTTLRQVR